MEIMQIIHNVTFVSQTRGEETVQCSLINVPYMFMPSFYLS